ncbi:MAG: amidohydrolase family protein [Blastocatellia bacterium]|nr:amidohydrolase family protein [Blastocatellia bacterium]MBN8723577.1 amidohydrolase family protein [Acidobacteriota bacterium]
MKLTRLLILLICLFITTSYVYAERPQIYALTNAKIVVAPGKVIEKGTIVLRDGLIEDVGANITVPADAVEIDLAGKTIYPGLIDINVGLKNLRRIAASPTTRGAAAQATQAQRNEPAAGAVHPLTRVRPENRVSEQLIPFEAENKDLESYRSLGITTVLLTPETGIFRGESALINLKETTSVSNLILRDAVAQHVAFEFGFFGASYPSSLFGAVAAFRQAMLDANRYKTWQERYKANPIGMKRPEQSTAFDALVPVLNRSRLVVFELSDNKDILLADRLAKEFNLNTIISSSGNEWELLEDIKGLKQTFVLSVAFPDKPKIDEADEATNVSLKELRRYVNAPENPKRLFDAGIRFAFTTNNLRNKADFSKNIRKIIAAGLSLDNVLAAFTTTPAEILGVSNSLGTLEKGKIANLIVANGELFGEKTKIENIFVDGVKYEQDSKKPMLPEAAEPKEGE